MQTKTQSFIEAISNTAVGFIVAFASTFIIFPLVGLNTSPGTNLVITIYFTIVSVLRGYIVRRWFNKKSIKKTTVNQLNGNLYWLHCFNCEMDMPVDENREVLYCSNCGLKH